MWKDPIPIPLTETPADIYKLVLLHVVFDMDGDLVLAVCFVFWFFLGFSLEKMFENNLLKLIVSGHQELSWDALIKLMIEGTKS